MPDWIIGFDRRLFQFINTGFANPVTDFIMPVVTNDWLLRALFVIVMLLLLLQGRKRFIWVAIGAALVVLLTDQISSHLLKPLIARPRPCHPGVFENIHLLVACGSGKSFPSSHAANLFGQAAFFGLLYRKYAIYVYIFAFLVGMSRVFVGVHYPFDVLGGIILGVFFGLAVAYFLKAAVQKKIIDAEIGIKENT